MLASEPPLLMFVCIGITCSGFVTRDAKPRKQKSTGSCPLLNAATCCRRNDALPAKNNAASLPLQCPDGQAQMWIMIYILRRIKAAHYILRLP